MLYNDKRLLERLVSCSKLFLRSSRDSQGGQELIIKLSFDYLTSGFDFERIELR
jgi:hypothetical protein